MNVDEVWGKYKKENITPVEEPYIDELRKKIDKITGDNRLSWDLGLDRPRFVLCCKHRKKPNKGGVPIWLSFSVAV